MINGVPGSGKSRLAARLAAALDVPWVELDALYHGPDWTPVDRRVFEAQVRAVADGAAWVIDGNYGAVREIVRARAELIVAIDLPRPLVMVQLVSRTLRRMVTGEELWNGNREELRNLLSTDPDRNLLLWAHRHFATYRGRAKADELASRAGGQKAVG